ncbi:MAG: NUDIX domain-containing protein [Solirubrobacteraceae bacterium]
MAAPNGLMARGPWDPGRVQASWRADPFQPTADVTAAADDALDALRRRGSPSHDGLAARLSGFQALPDRLALELEPVRWSVRLVAEHAAQSLSALTVVRAADGRWLAGRRAAWLASWAGRWALGAGGAVEVEENPAETLTRELKEEWSVAPASLTVEALVRLPSEMVLLIGLAWLPDGAPDVTPDPEHDAYAWWPADVDAWPPEADAPLRLLGGMLAAAQ